MLQSRISAEPKGLSGGKKRNAIGLLPSVTRESISTVRRSPSRSGGSFSEQHRKIVSFDSRLDFTVGWLPLLYVFPPHTKEKREERTRGNAFLRLPQVVGDFFSRSEEFTEGSARVIPRFRRFPAVFGVVAASGSFLPGDFLLTD